MEVFKPLQCCANTRLENYTELWPYPFSKWEKYISDMTILYTGACLVQDYKMKQHFCLKGHMPCQIPNLNQWLVTLDNCKNIEYMYVP